MAFIFTKDKMANGHTIYLQYLHQNKQHLPFGLWQIITSDWYYDPSDHRCPHDSALASLIVTDGAYTHLKKKEKACTSIILKLMGAYRDGYTTYTYRKVSSYSVKMNVAKMKHKPPCDWIRDEFRSVGSGLICHEIEWETGYWLIEAHSISHSWEPMVDG